MSFDFEPETVTSFAEIKLYFDESIPNEPMSGAP